MSNESDLEKQVQESKFNQIIDQIEQYHEERNYPEHYLENIKRIIFNVPIIDYRKFSHKNIIVHMSRDALLKLSLLSQKCSDMYNETMEK